MIKTKVVTKSHFPVLLELHMLYSLHHYGDIEIYKRTGSLTILKSAMGRIFNSKLVFCEV